MSAPKQIRSRFALGDARRLAAALCIAGAAALGCSAGDGTEDDSDGPGVADCGEGQVCTAQSLCAASVSGAPVLRRLTARELNASLNDVFPSLAGGWTFSFSADPVSHWGFDNESARLVVSKQTARELDATASSLAAAVSGAGLAGILPCATATPDRACAGEFVARFGKLLFRRPLAADESERYLAFFDEAAAKTDFGAAIGWVTRALVMAPATLYRRELGVTGESTRQLDQYEIATALAYTFAGTGPNENLLGMADRGELSSPDTLASLAQQLIESPQGKEHLHRFFEAFLEYSRVTTVTRDEASFTTLAPDMRQETRTFLEAVVFAGGGVRELLTSNQTFPSVALAGYYGMPAPAADYGAVTRPAGQGIGVLAQGSVLSTEAQPGWSSPTQRGLLVFERFLCREAPTVPPDVPPIPEVASGEVTTRQRYEQLHASGGTCQTCHREFDPIGFGFERFDQVGRFRDSENGLAIDASGSIPRTDPGVAFANQEELASGLADLPDVHLCVSSQVKTYAFGTEDACLGEGRRQEFVDGAIGFVQYLASLAAEPHFTSRRLQ